MKTTELASLIGVRAAYAEDFRLAGVRDIEVLSPEQPLEARCVYFIESPAVLKRHPLAMDSDAVILTTPALAEKFRYALVAPEGGARLALIALLKAYDRAPKFAPGVSTGPLVDPAAKIAASASVLPGACVMEGATIGERCVLYPGVVVEPYAELGDDGVLFPNVVLGHHCKVGKRAIIHGGTVIGADGFGFYDQPGQRHKIPQIGDVVIADDVEMGAGCTVDRATIESTIIGQFTKFDDQVHVGHNCRVGRYVYIVGNSAVGGSVVIGDGAMISGMVIVKDHLKIGAGSIIMGMSGVAQDTEPKTAYFGVPARPARQMHKMHAALERLPDLIAKVRELEERMIPAAP